MSSDVLSEDELSALNLDDEFGGSGLDLDLIDKFANSSLAAQSSVLSGVILSDAKVGKPKISEMSRNDFLDQLNGEIVEVKADFSAGVSGAQTYILEKNDGLKIVSAMMGQEQIDLDATAISTINEAFSQLTGTISTTLTGEWGKNFSIGMPATAKLPKDTLGLPGDKFVVLSYNVSLEGGDNLTMHQVLSIDLATEMESTVMQGKLSTGNSQANGGGGASAGGGGNGGDSGVMNAYNTPPSMQDLSLGKLNINLGEVEQRNISLLMDVEMELTVELGRTKWQIKDILQMGEGTIIELDKLAGEPIFVLVNGNPIARGEVLVIDENFAVRITDIVAVGQQMLE